MLIYIIFLQSTDEQTTFADDQTGFKLELDSQGTENQPIALSIWF